MTTELQTPPARVFHHESPARVLHHEYGRDRRRDSGGSIWWNRVREKRFTPGVLKWLDDRGWLFNHMGNEMDVILTLEPENVGKLLDAFPSLVALFHDIQWGNIRNDNQARILLPLFHEFVTRGAKFKPGVINTLGPYWRFYPIVVEALCEPPFIYRTSPFMAEVIAKFGIWSDRFDHPTINRMRWAERLKLLRKVMPEDGDGAIVFRVRSFCI